MKYICFDGNTKLRSWSRNAAVSEVSYHADTVPILVRCEHKPLQHSVFCEIHSAQHDVGRSFDDDVANAGEDLVCPVVKERRVGNRPYSAV